VIELEWGFNTNVDRIDDILSHPSELSIYIAELNSRKAVIDDFEHQATKENKHKAIAEQFLALQGLYLNAIKEEDDIVKAWIILSSYQEFVSPSISLGFWQDSWDNVKDLFQEQDPVEAVYNNREIVLEREEYLDLNINDPRLDSLTTSDEEGNTISLEELYMWFLTRNHEIDDIWSFNTRMWTAIQWWNNIKFRAIYDKLELWEKDEAFSEDIRSELSNIIEKINTTISN
jgi:hypothetical protein